MLRRLVPLTLVCTVLLTAGARATTVIPPTFDQLVAGARSIFVGEVVNQRAIWQPTPKGRSIVTIVTFRVDQVWKGSLGAQTQLEFLGGTIDDLRMEVVGMPEFTVGQRDVLFVSDEIRTVSPLVGFMHGRLRIEREAVSGVDRVRAFDGRSLASTADIGAARSRSLLSVTPMRLSELESAVRARLTTGRAR